MANAEEMSQIYNSGHWAPARVCPFMILKLSLTNLPRLEAGIIQVPREVVAAARDGQRRIDGVEALRHR